MSAETVDSSTAVGAKGSSPLEVRKTFSMVLLVVRIHPHAPNSAKEFLQEEITATLAWPGGMSVTKQLGKSPYG